MNSSGGDVHVLDDVTYTVLDRTGRRKSVLQERGRGTHQTERNVVEATLETNGLDVGLSTEGVGTVKEVASVFVIELDCQLNCGSRVAYSSLVRYVSGSSREFAIMFSRSETDCLCDHSVQFRWIVTDAET